MLDILCQEDQGWDVFIQLPDVQELTNADSGDRSDQGWGREPEQLGAGVT